jgi:hypothetical protein
MHPIHIADTRPGRCRHDLSLFQHERELTGIPYYPGGIKP